ncbi:hypothetical protein PoB_007284700 [Plakobranchus ocellatus]|uniref:Uncharacterized protein n=1 Tax=Plakobranchus ocellatus TaxID=259542 RepID=A0AAV4DQG3_9GAST|nr:hypothetical protein PoB_007284700 [Plakobranchus ocellatus]
MCVIRRKDGILHTPDKRPKLESSPLTPPNLALRYFNSRPREFPLDGRPALYSATSANYGNRTPHLLQWRDHV